MGFRTLPDGPVTLANLTVPGCLLGRDDSLVSASLSIADGRIVEDAPGAKVVDMGGAMAFPCFVDMHTHLDKGHIWPRRPNPDGSFDGALNAVRADKEAGNWGAADLHARMTFSLKSAYAHGTGAIRTHLDSFDPKEDVSWDVFARVKAEWEGRIALQASVLTTVELAAEPDLFERTVALVAGHGGTLGAVTYPIPDLLPNLRAYFDAAGERGMDLDFHVDETLDPSVNTLKTVAETALETGFQGRIAVGHLCSLSTMPETEALATLDLVARAGIGVVSLPMCNLYLQDRHAGRTPRYRGITLVHEMKARGIPVAFASDNTRDPFYAYGDMDMIEVMRQATRIGHLDHSDTDWTHAFLSSPAAICSFDAPSLAPGAPADLVITTAREWTELFARPQSDRIVLRGGRAIDRTLPPYSDLDALMTLRPMTRTA